MLWRLGLCPGPHLESLITAFPRLLDFEEKYEKWEKERQKGKEREKKSEMREEIKKGWTDNLTHFDFRSVVAMR